MNSYEEYYEYGGTTVSLSEEQARMIMKECRLRKFYIINNKEVKEYINEEQFAKH